MCVIHILVSSTLWYLKWQYMGFKFTCSLKPHDKYESPLFTHKQRASKKFLYECIGMISSYLFICWNAVRWLIRCPRTSLSSHTEFSRSVRWWEMTACFLRAWDFCLITNFLPDRFLDLQLKQGTDERVRMLVETLFFYIAILLEAFIFCFLMII